VLMTSILYSKYWHQRKIILYTLYYQYASFLQEPEVDDAENVKFLGLHLKSPVKKNI
jgi:hypothetical protein